MSETFHFVRLVLSLKSAVMQTSATHCISKGGIVSADSAPAVTQTSATHCLSKGGISSGASPPAVLLSFATHYLLKGGNGNTGTVSVFLRFGKHIFFAVDGKLLLEFLVVCRLEVVYITVGIKTVIVYLYHTYRNI